MLVVHKYNNNNNNNNNFLKPHIGINYINLIMFNELNRKNIDKRI